jgi:DNA repair protein RecN (Recombination protein N)
MLRMLQIRDFAIVPALELEFESGFTAITGETGAGKSIIVDALGLLAGNRADTGAIRNEEDKAELSAEFELTDSHPASAWLKSAELEEDDLCIVRRVISRSGRSRAWINGRAVTLNQMQELGGLLIEIHGQNEHMKLTRPAEQFRLLDSTGAFDTELASLAKSFGQWQALNEEHDRLTAQSPLDAGELDLLRYQLEELKSDALPADAVAGLELEHSKLSRGSEFADAASQAAQMLNSSEDGLAISLTRIVQLLEPLAGVDPQVGEAVKMLREAGINIDEAANVVENCRSTLDLSPERLNQLERQLTRLHDLARKHQVGMDDLEDVQQRLENRLESAAHAGERLKKIEEELQKALKSYNVSAMKLHKVRTREADRLSVEVSEQMQLLSMEGGQFVIKVNIDNDARPSARGRDKLELLVSANPGTAPGPLAKVASGGELSRISLALKVSAAARDSDATQIFDEVDAGIGGDTANAVGRMLGALTDSKESTDSTKPRSGQVLCVTHLAQVAACAGQQIKVAKENSVKGAAINTNVLATGARVEEIARMLSGLVSESSLKHARELIGKN